MQCFAIFVNLFFCYTAESAASACNFNYLISLSFSRGGEL
jgi:hypothetical protein